MTNPTGPTTVTVSVVGDRLEDALSAALERIIAVAQGEEPVAERGSLSLPIRGEGSDVPTLLADLAGSLVEAIQGQGEAVSAVSIAGVLTTERGLTGWGFATVARGTPVRLRPFDLSAPILVQRHGHAVEIGTTVVVG